MGELTPEEGVGDFLLDVDARLALMGTFNLA